jgi:hypothetical protein
LFEEDEKSVMSCPENAELHDDLETNNNVDVLVDKIVKDLEEANDNDLHIDNEDRCELVNLETTAPVEKHASEVPQLGSSDSPKSVSQADGSLSTEADFGEIDGSNKAMEEKGSAQVPLVGGATGLVGDGLV